jgi:hypothetical protein
VGLGSVAATHDLIVDAPQIKFFQFGQPSGTDSIVLWEGASDSLDQHGAIGDFRQQIRDPSELENKIYVRFTVPFLSNSVTEESQSINEIRLPYFFLGLND